MVSRRRAWDEVKWGVPAVPTAPLRWAGYVFAAKRGPTRRKVVPWWGRPWPL